MPFPFQSIIFDDRFILFSYASILFIIESLNIRKMHSGFTLLLAMTSSDVNNIITL